MRDHTPITWRAHEHAYTEKGADWFWAVGLVTVAIIATAIIFEQVLFGVLIAVGAFALTIQSLKKPRFLEYQINMRGVRAGDSLYPYGTLESFWVEVLPNEQTLILKSKKLLMPYIIIPIDEVDADMVRDYLFDYLEEEEHVEPLSHKIMERLGF